MTEDRLVRDPDPLDPEDRYILVTPVPSFSHGLLLMTFNLDVTSADASLLSLTKKALFQNRFIGSQRHGVPATFQVCPLSGASTIRTYIPVSPYGMARLQSEVLNRR